MNLVEEKNARAEWNGTVEVTVSRIGAHVRVGVGRGMNGGGLSISNEQKIADECCSHA